MEKKALHDTSILFVNMPFGPLLTPSLALSNIKAYLHQHNLESRVFYPNIEFARIIGEEFYHLISSGLPRAHDLAGEFVFSRTLFGEQATETDVYLSYLRGLLHSSRRRTVDEHFTNAVDMLIDNMESFQQHAEVFVNSQAEKLANLCPAVVGFTSAFQQNTASLSVAKRLKSLDPSIQILFGGANCEGEMGHHLHKLFGFIDCVVTGEAEPVILGTLSYLCNGGEVPIAASVLTRAHPTIPDRLRPRPTTDLNDIPTPDFRDFFKEASTLTISEKPKLLFESSRGCWWGEKHHCTFCGLNGNTMKFRQKEPLLFLQQLEELSDEYPDTTICMTDNIIDHRYFRTLLPALADKKLDLDLFYEVKANLRREQVELIARAGIKRIQPGIESFSSSILKIMDKGVSAIQNVQLLKWCLEFGVEAEWNFLWGFPSEPASEYARMAEFIPHFMHLKPPNGIGKLRLDRFSPYYKDSVGRFKNVRPFEAYTIVYPLPIEDVAKIAYFFDGDFDDGNDPADYTSLLQEEVEAWRRNRNKAYLFYCDFNGACAVFDSRGCGGHSSFMQVFDGCEREILLRCDSALPIVNLRATLTAFTEAQIDAAIARLHDDGLIFEDAGTLLNLALHLSPSYPGMAVLEALKFD